MLKVLTLKNFQSHPATRIEFGPGINAILGASDKGKSATLRGLEWVRTNRPNGDAHVSDWALDSKGKQTDECRVTVETDKHKVERVRNGKVNGYVLDGATIEATKGELPAEVTAALGLLDLNVQKQLDGPFLLSQSGGEVARFFNSLVNLEEIDHCMSAADGLKREILADIRKTNETIETTNASLVRYSWVDDARESLEALRKSYSEANELRSKLKTLRELSERRAFVVERKAKAEATIRIEADVVRLRARQQEHTAAQLQLEALNTLHTRRTQAALVLERFALFAPVVTALATYRASQKEMLGVSARLNILAEKRTKREATVLVVFHARTVMNQASRLDSLREMFRDREGLEARRVALAGTLARRSTASATLARLTPMLALNTTRLAEFLRIRSEKLTRKEALFSLSNRRERCYTSIEESRKEIEALKAQLPEVCPTCNKPYGDRHEA